MEEAAGKNLEVFSSYEVYSDLMLPPRESAAADNGLYGHLHEDQMPFDEGIEDWTQLDLLDAFYGTV